MRRDINFFSVYHAHDDGGLSKKLNVIALSATIGICAVIFGTFLSMKIADLSASAGISAARSVIDSPAAADAALKLKVLNQKLAALNQYKQAASKASSGFAAMPKISSEVLGEIARCEPSDVTVGSVNYSGGILTLACTSGSDASAAVFVHELEQSGRFSAVNYPGVTQGGDAKKKLNYSFSVSITFREDISK